MQQTREQTERVDTHLVVGGVVDGEPKVSDRGDLVVLGRELASRAIESAPGADCQPPPPSASASSCSARPMSPVSKRNWAAVLTGDPIGIGVGRDGHRQLGEVGRRGRGPRLRASAVAVGERPCDIGVGALGGQAT